ncbi:signal peptidase I [Candidatus Gracilibacteria bacterium]|nr:signal peptidase I [Candidatus Gracilibacteria bacterium]
MKSGIIGSIKRSLEQYKSRFPQLYFLGDLILNVVAIVLMVLIVRTYVISPFQVNGSSMCNTLNYIDDKCYSGNGEYLIVNKAVYYPFFGHSYRTPERGDIVVFKPPKSDGKEYFIKRVIGLPGEKVSIHGGKVYIINKENPKGKELVEPYLNESNQGKTYPEPFKPLLTKDFAVPEGMYFVMGDNRNGSTDSRQCFLHSASQDCKDQLDHFLAFEEIEGRAAVVLWPFGKIRFLTNPTY